VYTQRERLPRIFEVAQAIVYLWPANVGRRHKSIVCPTSALFGEGYTISE